MLKLIKTGLSKDEAESIVTIWSKEFFTSPGLTLFYLLPQKEYDRLLHITILPKPEEIIRTGIVHHPRADFGGYKRIEELIMMLGAPKAEDRISASKELESFGPLALGPLAKAVRSADNQEIRQHCSSLIKKLSAECYLKGTDEKGTVEKRQKPPKHHDDDIF